MGNLKTVAGLALLLSILGCGKSEEEVIYYSSGEEELTFEVNEEIPKEVIATSCAVPANEGDTVEETVLAQALNEPKVIAGPFDKPYPSAWIETLYTTSLDATVEAVRKFGVHLFKAPPRFAETCRPFDKLSKPTHPDLVNYSGQWFKNPKSAKEPFRKGIFVYSNNGESSIIVREDSDRWTLLHEFLHYAFYTQKDKAALAFGDIQKRYVDGRNDLLKILEDKEEEETEENDEDEIEVAEAPKEEKVKQALASWSTLSRTLSQLLINYQLEEISIEYLLLKALQEQKIKHVTERSKYQKHWYFLENSRQAKDLIWGAMQFNNMLLEESKTLNIALEADQETLLKQNKELFNGIWSQIDKLTAELGRGQETNPPVHASLHVDENPSETSKPCAHNKSLESMSRDMMRFQKLLR